ncbi:hypothetical protein HMPREF9349_02543 [Escherichia coli MS 79-10]|nr:hypothetical protein HMPREF9346_02884 [Escherichia coli MS 119-7]EFK50583.1 hypothetical protein HMPREF9345_02903 [Escherichia coli MS 107-1]EGU97512.1 hypothetical protein HMPREF9349_02543 [Escherichia coli MS 79-10]
MAKCKDIDVLLFVFARCTAPFRSKILKMHSFGATADLWWCNPVASRLISLLTQ